MASLVSPVDGHIASAFNSELINIPSEWQVE